MSTIDTIEAAEDRRAGRPRGSTDREKRKSPKFRPQDAIKAASLAGYGKVRVTVDNDGRITVEMGQGGDLPDGPKREQNEWDTRLEEIEKAARDDG
jgi:hypothetical protein